MSTLGFSSYRDTPTLGFPLDKDSPQISPNMAKGYRNPQQSTQFTSYVDNQRPKVLPTSYEVKNQHSPNQITHYEVTQTPLESGEYQETKSQVGQRPLLQTQNYPVKTTIGSQMNNNKVAHVPNGVQQNRHPNVIRNNNGYQGSNFQQYSPNVVQIPVTQNSSYKVSSYQEPTVQNSRNRGPTVHNSSYQHSTVQQSSPNVVQSPVRQKTSYQVSQTPGNMGIPSFPVEGDITSLINRGISNMADMVLPNSPLSNNGDIKLPNGGIIIPGLPFNGNIQFPNINGLSPLSSIAGNADLNGGSFTFNGNGNMPSPTNGNNAPTVAGNGNGGVHSLTFQTNGSQGGYVNPTSPNNSRNLEPGREISEPEPVQSKIASRPASQQFQKLRQQCLSAGRLWEDPDFTACSRSLYYREPPSVPVQQIRWLRPGVSLLGYMTFILIN